MKNTIYIKLFAGLGNQIFQYVYGQYLALNGKNVKYISDKTVGNILSVFAIPLENLQKIYEPKGILKMPRLILKKIYAKYILKAYYTDFYQDKKYAQTIQKNNLLNLTFLHQKTYHKTKEYKIIKTTNSVSLHIRGGDYLEPTSNIFTGICTPLYYKNAINYIKNATNEPHFFIFTNDVPYSKNILEKLPIKNSEYTIVQNNEFITDTGFDLFLMTQCKHNIIANSTYSWWGAFLNENTNNVVLVPQHWQNNTNDTSLILNNWIKLSYE